MNDGIYDFIIQHLRLFICIYKHLYMYNLYLYLSLVCYKILNTLRPKGLENRNDALFIPVYDTSSTKIF